MGQILLIGAIHRSSALLRESIIATIICPFAKRWNGAMAGLKLKWSIWVLLVSVTSTAFFATVVHAQNEDGLRNATILIIRHAEQQDDGAGLSSVGEARAQAYVNYFKTFTIDGQPLKLNYLFAARDSYNSQRPRLTVQPTADALGLAINGQFKDKQIIELVGTLKELASGSQVLICWRHGKIPQLLDALGADARALLPMGRWPGYVFGWVIQLRYDQSGRLAESKRINERLLPDD